MSCLTAHNYQHKSSAHPRNLGSLSKVLMLKEVQEGFVESPGHQHPMTQLQTPSPGPSASQEPQTPHFVCLHQGSLPRHEQPHASPSGYSHLHRGTTGQENEFQACPASWQGFWLPSSTSSLQQRGLKSACVDLPIGRTWGNDS